MLKFSFPVNVELPVATYETAYGNIERSTNGDEDPGQRWIDMSGKNNFGLTVINDAKYGYSVPGNDLRISVARSAVYAHHNPRVLDMNAEHLWMDQGIQTFRMLLVPHIRIVERKQCCQNCRRVHCPSCRYLPGHTWRFIAKIGFFPFG